MLEGIEILAQSEIMQAPNRMGLVLAIIFCGLIIGILGWACDIDILFVPGTILAALGMTAALIIMSTNPKESTGRYEYQVTISDDVSFTEFYEHYEVVDQNGKIWTIRDKNIATD